MARLGLRCNRLLSEVTLLIKRKGCTISNLRRIPSYCANLKLMNKFLLLWCLGASLIAVLLYQFNMPRLYPLATKGIQTCGTVTDFEPNNHQEVHYSFVANGKAYSGAQQGCRGDQRKSFACS